MALKKFKQSKLESPTGATINLLHMAPKGKPKGVVHINHGMAEHAACYERFAQALVAAGYAAYAHDHRGHGHTTAPDAPLGVYAASDGFTKVLADVDAVNTHIREAYKETPIIVFGHSMGAVIAANYAMRNPDKLAGFASWNAGLEAGGLVAISGIVYAVLVAFKGRHHVSKLIYNLTFGAWNKAYKPNRTEFDWISSDPAVVDNYIADPLCGIPITVGLWQDLTLALKFGARDGNLAGLRKDMPVHLQGSALDPVTEGGKHMKKLCARLKSAGLTDVTLNVIGDIRHDSLNDVTRTQTTAEFISWLNARFA